MDEQGFIARIENAPCLFGGEGKYRRHELEQRVPNQRQRGLRGTARAAVAPGGVEAILQHIEIEAAELLGAIRLQALYREVELVALVVASDRLKKSICLGDRVAVE